MIEISKIKIDEKLKLRADFNLEEAEKLKASIQELGLLQPIIVQETEEGFYNLVAGYRRLLAVKELGWKEIPAKIIEKSYDKTINVAFAENLLRLDLSAIETAEALKKFKEENNLTWAEVSDILHLTERRIYQLVEVLELSDEVKEVARRLKSKVSVIREAKKKKTKEEQIEVLEAKSRKLPRKNALLELLKKLENSAESLISTYERLQAITPKELLEAFESSKRVLSSTENFHRILESRVTELDGLSIEK